MMPEKIIECPDCGSEICIKVDIVVDLIFVYKTDEDHDFYELKEKSQNEE